MRDRRRMNQLLGLGFAVLLAGFTAASYFHKDTAFSDTENRMLQQKPVFSWADLADGRFMGNFEKYQTDQFILRREWIGLQTAADRLLGKNKSGDVYLGEGQLLEEPSKLSENVWENLDAIGAFCRNQTGVKCYLMLVPDAASVQREKLPAYAPVADQAKQLEEIRSYLEKKENPVTEIPLYEMLREHREEALYYRTDHHWTTLGARYAYQSAAGQMGLPGAENGEEKKLYPVSDSFQGTLAARSGYRVPDDTIEVYWPDQEEELVVTYVQEQTKSASLYAAEKLKTRDKYGMFLNGNHPLTEIRTMASTGRKLLLIKDSYANCFVPFLTGDFEEIVLVDPRYYYDSAEKLMKQYGFTDVLFLYNLNTFLEDDVLHYVLE